MVDISDLQAKYGAPCSQDTGFLPFRCYAANLVVGGQGLRRGQVVEIFGPEGSGKSTLLYELLGIAASMGCIVILLDKEKSAEASRLAKFGLIEGQNLIKMKHQPYLEADYEKLCEILENIRKAHPNVPVVIGHDSVGITLPREHYEKFFITDKKGEVKIDLSSNEKTAANAKAWAKVMRALFSQFYEMNITVLALNHQTELIQHGIFGAKGGGPKYTTPGGRTLKHMGFTRLSLTPIGKIKVGDHIIGNKVKLKTIKCKDAPPFQEVMLPLYFGNPALPPDQDYAGTFDCGAAFEHLKNCNAIQTSGSWSKLRLLKADGTVQEEIRFQGENGFRGVWLTHREAIYTTMYKWHYASTAWAMTGSSSTEDDD